MARGRRSWRLRVRHDVRDSHAALSRVAVAGHDTSHRAHRARQRRRCVAGYEGRLVRPLQSALRTWRRSPGCTSRIVAFSRDPWPTWEYEVDDGTRIRHEIV